LTHLGSRAAPQFHPQPSQENGVNSASINITRILWIVGLSFAFLFFGAWTIVIIYAGISHRHLNPKGIFMLLSDGYVAWITFQYLCQKIAERKSAPVGPGNSN
jgi:hypothetical protein